MKEYHLIPFVLFYFVMKRQSSTTLTLPEFHHIFPKYTEYAVSLLPLLYMLRTGNTSSVEHLLVILSYMCAIKSVKSFATGNEAKLSQLLLPICIVSCLMNMYVDVRVRQYAVVLYMLFAVYATTLITSKKTTISESIDDFVFAHLIFYFTK